MVQPGSGSWFTVYVAPRVCDCTFGYTHASLCASQTRATFGLQALDQATSVDYFRSHKRNLWRRSMLQGLSSPCVLSQKRAAAHGIILPPDHCILSVVQPSTSATQADRGASSGRGQAMDAGASLDGKVFVTDRCAKLWHTGHGVSCAACTACE